MEDVGESKSGIYDDVKNIPQINKIKENGEKELNDSMLLESSKKYLEDLKSYKGGSDEHWVQGFSITNILVLKMSKLMGIVSLLH